MTSELWTRRRTVTSLLAGPAILAAPQVLRAQDLTKVRFGTNWVAEAEHGGFYQSVADGTYAALGLDVEIVMGGPQSNNRLLFYTRGLDFYMGGNMIQAFSAVREDIPSKVVAAIFQKDPQCLIAHPGAYAAWEDLKSAESIYLSNEAVASFYQWMITAFGFRPEQVKPYTYNYAPFLLDPTSVQQGYATSDPYKVGLEGGFTPDVFLLADQGFSTYSTTIEARTETIEGQADIVQRFVDGSILGYTNFLYGDNAAARDLILAANPDTNAERMDATIANMKSFGIVDSGDTTTLGIGAMTDARMKDFFDAMVTSGVVDGTLDLAQSYVLDFVNKGVGLDIAR
jgi:NitT/TauT family transport system substrate-binding protein